MEQLIIAITGVSAIWLANDERVGWRRYACVFGLIGQPFWLFAFYSNGQWGMFVLSVVYTAAWMKGFNHHWLKRAVST